MLHTPVDFLPVMTPHNHMPGVALLFKRDELLIRDADHSLPSIALAGEMTRDTLHPVGVLAGSYYAAAVVASSARPLPGYTFRKLRSLFSILDETVMGVAARGCQIAEWARTHRFCGACATPAVLLEGERCLQCPACGHVAYPRISPAMMVLIRKGEAILLARHAGAPTNRFSPLAGFLEAGESAEEAVHREVMEEVGLRVENLRYFGTQSWPFPHSLMIAFTAEYLDGEIQVDGKEILEARWFAPGDTLPDYTKGISISGALIEAHLPWIAKSASPAA